MIGIFEGLKFSYENFIEANEHFTENLIDFSSGDENDKQLLIGLMKNDLCTTGKRVFIGCGSADEKYTLLLKPDPGDNNANILSKGLGGVFS